jgi:hypothetical protein
MQALIFRPHTDLEPTPALEQHLERHVFGPARGIGEELSLVAITEPPPPVSIIHPPQGGTWVAAYHNTDPVAKGRGGYLHAPEDEIERLMRLFDAGVDPEVILIVHQLNGRWRQGDPVPAAFLPGETSTTNRTLAVQAMTIEAGRALLRAVGRVTTGIALGLGAAAAVGAGSLASVALVDPFILGGVRDPQTGLIGWVYLGGWDEEPAE